MTSNPRGSGGHLAVELAYGRPHSVVSIMLKVVFVSAFFLFLMGCQRPRAVQGSPILLSGDSPEQVFSELNISLSDASMESCLDFLRNNNVNVIYNPNRVLAQSSGPPVTLKAEAIQLFDFLAILCVHFEIRIVYEKRADEKPTVTVLDSDE